MEAFNLVICQASELSHRTRTLLSTSKAEVEVVAEDVANFEEAEVAVDLEAAADNPTEDLECVDMIKKDATLRTAHFSTQADNNKCNSQEPWAFSSSNLQQLIPHK